MLNLTITEAGRAEFINAAHNGTNAVIIASAVIGSAVYEPDQDQTALQDPIKTLATVSGQQVEDGVIHVMIRDTSADEYTVGEIGLLTDSGTLFAVCSQQGLIAKAAGSAMMLALDVALSTLPTSGITFGDTNFLVPPASETTAGVVRYATAEEASDGTGVGVVSNAQLDTVLKSMGLRGDVKLALERLPVGTGNGLDADLLDGQQGSFYRDASNMNAGQLPDARLPTSLIESIVPTGMVLPFANNTPPPGFLKANGFEVSRTLYSKLFAAIGTTYGAGDGETTFNLPDLRGEFIRGWDDGRGVDAGRVIGSFQNHALEYHNHLLPTGAGSGTYNLPGIIDSCWDTNGGNNTFPADGVNAVTDQDGMSLYGQNGGNRANETRSRNIALLYCIKY